MLPAPARPSTPCETKEKQDDVNTHATGPDAARTPLSPLTAAAIDSFADYCDGNSQNLVGVSHLREHTNDVHWRAADQFADTFVVKLPDRVSSTIDGRHHPTE